MEISKNKKPLICFCIAILAGLSAGSFLIRIPSVSFSISDIVPRDLTISTAKDIILPLCATAVLESMLIFVSGFTFHPLILSTPVFILRSASTAVSFRVFGLSGQNGAIIISYTIITVLMVILALLAYCNSKERSIGRKKTYFHYIYAYLMINGAVITVRTAPFLIMTKI